MTAAATGRSAGRVLVVDDEPALREIYTAFLEDGGYEVVAADSGRSAVTRLDQGAFDLVLTDIRMPDGDGVDVLRAVRERDLDVPVVLVTGSPTVETAVQALELGALGYLVKPVEEKALLETAGRGVRLHKLAVLKRQALTELGDAEKLVGDRAGLEVTYRRGVDALWIAFQPIFDAASDEIYGHEALLRTSEPSVPNPGVFLDVAERLGRLPELGRNARERAAVAAPREGALFVNLHPHELVDERLYSSESPLTAIAGRVVLEVTERESLSGVRDLESRIKRLKGLGFRVAVDDLGAGYAGLTSFAAIQPDIIKLDMTLIRDCHVHDYKRRLIGSIAALCKELQIRVVAEGIETEAERSTVVELGCDLLQGFLLGRPERIGEK